MNQEKIDKVNAAISGRRDKGILYFCEYTPGRWGYVKNDSGTYNWSELIECKFNLFEDEKTILDFPTLESLIWHILFLCKSYSSCRKYIRKPKYKKSEYIFETSSERSRSSYDIWRHCLAYDKNITLAEIMETLANMPLGHHYCHTVKRLVFYRTPAFGSKINPPIADEYGLRGYWLE